jgi:hypothetical protein
MTKESTPKEVKKKLHPDTQEMLDNAAKKQSEKIANNPFVAFTARYRSNPVLFVKEVLNTNPDPWQETLLNHIAKGERRISVRSGHGVGKSTGASWAIIWYLLLRYPVKVVVTAPTSSQLYDALFAELKRWVKELPPTLRDMLEVKQDRIEVKEAQTEAFVSARTSRAEQPEALQGVHSENVMLIGDEASGIPEQVFEAAAGSMSGHNAVTILLGNPVRSSGFFYDTHNRLANDWVTMKVSCVDSPRVSDAYVEEMKARYGEESNAYRIRVLGEFPRSDDDTIIPMELLELAKHRDVATSPHAKLIWGLDVARFGGDRSALAKRQGNALIEPIKTWKNLDLMQLTGAVVAEWEALMPSQRPHEILVDSIGLGAGVVDRLRELGLPVRGINVSESPAMGTTYKNLRAELWYKTKAWFEARDCRIPLDEALVAELATVRYFFTSNGKIQIESKDDIRKRGLKSPDCFVAGTMVLTPSGEVPIESINVGDVVSTPVGNRVVIKNWESTTTSLTTVDFSNGRSITGKGSHKIFTWDEGWVRLDSLSLDNTIESVSIIKGLKWSLWNLLSTKKKNFGFKRQVDISSLDGKIQMSDFYTDESGLTRLVKFLKDITYTIKMAIGVTTQSPILNASMALNTDVNICFNDGKMMNKQSLSTKDLMQQEKQQSNGTHHQKGLHGTVRMENKHGTKENLPNALAKSVAACSPASSLQKQNFAQSHARKRTLIKNTHQKASAATARLNLLLTNIGLKSVALETAPISCEVSETKVYNLTLDEDNVYYANGILVANCADAFVLTFASDAAIGMFGANVAQQWSKPLRRNVSRVA